MSRFVQFHTLTAYPPSNPNRDDLGRPKTAMYGGHPRMRISSQALKRAYRTSEAFQANLAGALADRTQRLGEDILAHLKARDVDEGTARRIARDVAGAFGKLKKDDDSNPTRIEQLAFVSPDERALAFELADELAKGGKAPSGKDLAKRVLKKADGAVDIAMFGRMLADTPDFNRDAAVQVAHALSTNRVDIEDDYYTAVDDLKRTSEDAGAGFIGELGFGAGVFYLYACVDRALLVENLAGDQALAERALAALTTALATATPPGKKNAFAHQVCAEFMLVERGDQQPRSLASAFLDPVDRGDQLSLSRKALVELRGKMAAVYGRSCDAEITLDVRGGGESLAAVAAFAADGLAGLA